MRNIFKRTKTDDHSGLAKFGCVSRRDHDPKRRDNDLVIVVGESNGTLTVSKFSRKASLETLRLNGLIRTSAANYQARTQRLVDLQYPGVTDEIKIGGGFINYLKGQKVSLQDKCAAFTVDAGGTVAGVTAREKDVAEAAVSVEGFRARADESCPVEVETRGRSALRLYLNLRIPRRVDFDSLPLTVCAAVVEDHGYSLVFWNEEKGVCWEVENPFGKDDAAEDNWAAFADELRRSLSLKSLESIGVGVVGYVAIAANEDCREFLQEDLAADDIKFESIEFNEGTDFVLMTGSWDLADSQIAAIVAAGLVIEDERVPPVNLNRDLEAFIRSREQERVRNVQRKTAAANRNLGILVIAPVILAVICLVIWYVTLLFQDGFVERRSERAKVEDARLTSVKKELQNVKTSSDQVQIVSDTIGNLKKRQPANFLLLMNLNRKWPPGGDWQIDEITSKPDGTVTIKGKTRSDDSLTEFATSLDFSEDFEAVKVSKGEGAAGGAIAAPGMMPSGVIKFAVETRYLPLAAPAGGKAVLPALPAGTQPNQTVPPPQVAGAANPPVPRKPNS